MSTHPKLNSFLGDAIGRNIQIARKILRMTQVDLASASKLSTTSIVQLEGGTGNPSLGVMQSIARVFSVKIPLLIVSSLGDLQDYERVIRPPDELLVQKVEKLLEEIAPRRRILESPQVIARFYGEGNNGLVIGAAIGTSIQPGYGTLMGAHVGDLYFEEVES